MTTRIHDPEQGPYLPAYVDLTATGNTVTVRASNGLMGGTAKVDRAEFLAAVANELDVIVTPRSDLPEVTSTYAGGLRAIHGPTGSEATIRAGDAADDIRGLALCYLAMAERLKNNPPVKVTTAAIDCLLAQVQTDRERSNYWKARRPDLDVVEAYLGALRDHLTTQDGAR